MKKLIIIIYFLVFATSSMAQTQDMEVWTGAEINKKFNKEFSASLEQQVRLNENVSHFKTTFTEIGLSYKINKY